MQLSSIRVPKEFYLQVTMREIFIDGTVPKQNENLSEIEEHFKNAWSLFVVTQRFSFGVFWKPPYGATCAPSSGTDGVCETENAEKSVLEF